MKKVLFTILAVLLLVGSIFLTTGCARAAQRATSRAIESVIEKELAKEGITVKGDGEEYTMKAETDDGTSEMTNPGVLLMMEKICFRSLPRAMIL